MQRFRAASATQSHEIGLGVDDLERFFVLRIHLRRTVEVVGVTIIHEIDQPEVEKQ